MILSKELLLLLLTSVSSIQAGDSLPSSNVRIRQLRHVDEDINFQRILEPLILQQDDPVVAAKKEDGTKSPKLTKEPTKAPKLTKEPTKAPKLTKVPSAPSTKEPKLTKVPSAPSTKEPKSPTVKVKTSKAPSVPTVSTTEKPPGNGPTSSGSLTKEKTTKVPSATSSKSPTVKTKKTKKCKKDKTARQLHTNNIASSSSISVKVAQSRVSQYDDTRQRNTIVSAPAPAPLRTASRNLDDIYNYCDCNESKEFVGECDEEDNDNATTSPTVTPNSNNPATNNPATSPTVAPNSVGDTIDAPGFSPVEIPQPKSPACQALENGEIYNTGEEVEVEFSYEMYLATSTPNNATANSDLLEKNQGLLLDQMATVIVAYLLGCDVASNRKLTSPNIVGVQALVLGKPRQEQQRQLVIDGVDTSTVHTKNDEFECQQPIVGTVCNIMVGSVILYLNEETSEPSKESIADDSAIALEGVKKAMEEDTLIVGDIHHLKYMGMIVRSIKDKPKGPRDSETKGDGASAIGTELVAPEAAKSISAMGIALITMAAIGTALVGAVAVRKRQDSRLKTHEVFQDDESTIITKQTKASGNPGAYDFRDDDQHTVAMSTTSSATTNWRHTRGAHIQGEDDSVISSSNRGIIDDLRQIEEHGTNGDVYEDEFDSHDLVNVHHCTSLTCELCAPKNDTQFVSSLYQTSVQENLQSPSSLNQREYRTDDTVQF